MTVVVGIVHNNVVHMAADTQASSCYVKHTISSKVFYITNGKEKLLIGFCGTLRLMQIVKYHLVVPEHQEGDSDEEYLCTAFISRLRHACVLHGFSVIDNSEEKFSSGSILVGYRGKLFVIENNFQVMEIVDNYTAIGSGMEFSLGSLHTSEDYTNILTPLDRLSAAIYAACEFCPSVGIKDSFSYMTLGSSHEKVLDNSC